MLVAQLPFSPTLFLQPCYHCHVVRTTPPPSPRPPRLPLPGGDMFPAQGMKASTNAVLSKSVPFLLLPQSRLWRLQAQEERGQQERANHLCRCGRGGHCKGGAPGSGGLPQRCSQILQTQCQDPLWGPAVWAPRHRQNPTRYAIRDAMWHFVRSTIRKPIRYDVRRSNCFIPYCLVLFTTSLQPLARFLVCCGMLTAAATPQPSLFVVLRALHGVIWLHAWVGRIPWGYTGFQLAWINCCLVHYWLLGLG